MKKLSFFLILLAAATGSFAQTLVAHYDFTNAASTGTASEPTNSLHGTVSACTAASGKCGAPNTALKFNGRSSVVTIPASTKLDLRNWTIQAVVYLDAFETRLDCQVSKILQHGQQYSNNYYALEINDNNDDITCGQLNYCNSPVDTNHMCFYGSAGGSLTVGMPSSSLHTKKWYCLTATFSHDTMKYYVNGVLNYKRYWKNVYAYGGVGSSVPPVVLQIGKGTGSGGTTYYFDGTIDDVQLFDGAMTAAQVADLCTTCETTTCDIDDVVYFSKLTAPMTYTFLSFVTPVTHCVQWTFGDGSGTVTSSPSAPINHTYAANGAYTVCAKAYDCNTGVFCELGKCFTICVNNTTSTPPGSTGTGSTGGRGAFESGVGNPYPNPTNAVLNIPVQNLNGTIVLTVTGIDGKTVLTKTSVASKSTNTLQLDMEPLAPGVYMLGIACGDQKVYKRFSKL